jgi:CHAD domain-containing protein
MDAIGRYRLEPGEATNEEVRRVAHERAQSAINALRDRDADPAEAVHGARKDLKKLRAVLRLVRPELGETYGQENERYRVAARGLSDARDAQVRSATVSGLADRFASDPPAGGWAALRDAIGGGPPPDGELAEAREHAATAIAQGKEKIDSWPLSRADFKLLRKGLRRSYARGRKRYRAAVADPTDESLHDWRKREKDLWYHLRLLRDGWPEALGPAADEAHRLADLLGDEHDLVVLTAYLESDAATVRGPQRAHLQKLIAKRRSELQSEAFALGERLYAEKPKRFVASIERHWRAQKP